MLNTWHTSICRPCPIIPGRIGVLTITFSQVRPGPADVRLALVLTIGRWWPQVEALAGPAQPPLSIPVRPSEPPLKIHAPLTEPLLLLVFVLN